MATKPAATRVEPILTAVGSTIPMPARNKARGSKSIYPFDSLAAVGNYFGVKNRSAKQLSSILSNANRKALVNKTDETGAVVFKTKELAGPDGPTTVPTTEPEKVAGKHFYAVDVIGGKVGDTPVKGTDLEGCMAVVFRDL
jgi:hypothetical protein